jgi:hypothetical protein
LLGEVVASKSAQLNLLAAKASTVICRTVALSRVPCRQQVQVRYKLRRY